MKKLIAILLGAIMFFSLTACGENTENPADSEKVNTDPIENEVENQVEEPASESTDDQLEATEKEQEKEEHFEQIPETSTKTLAYFREFLSGGEYTMEMKSVVQGVEVTIKTAYKGDMMYSESNMDGIKSVMVIKDGFQYIIDNGSKMVIKMQAVDNGTVTDIFSDEAANYETAVASGEMEYNGKTYEYEEFTVDGETARYLFDGDELKIIKAITEGEESVVEIISLEKGADASLFEIPEDYQIIAY